MQRYFIEAFTLLAPLWTADFALNYWYYLRKRYGWWDYPLDSNKNFFDGKRIFGNSKTVLGLPISLIFGTLGGFIISDPFIGCFLGLMVYLAAIIAGFTKRRLGLQRGAAFPVIDQTDYIIAAYMGLKLLGMEFVSDEGFIAAFFISLVIHSSSNVIGYYLGIKKNPW